MHWIVLFVAALLACELIVRLPLRDTLERLPRYAGKARRVISNSAISDHWKERVLPRYALRIAAASLLSFLWLVVSFAPIFLVGFVWPGGWTAFSQTMLSLWVILGLSAFCMGWIWVRSRVRTSNTDPQAGASGAYGFGDKILHRLALGAPVLPEVLHDVEKAIFLGSAPDPEPANHVFVAGLARAGTTILMREIYNSGDFGSLTYEDMPLVLAPNLWSRLAKHRKIESHERAHGDGIKVDGTSPEALEEVFWRVHDGKAYIQADRLVPHNPDDELLDNYADFIRLILRKTGKTRYLAKNNDNILRLGSLSERFPSSLLLVPFREPLDHAASLLRQHERFSESDSFTRSYMGWLGHYEFGADHRPFEFGAVPEGSPGSIEYWLDLWVRVYGHLATLEPRQNIRFVNFERLKSEPDYWERLATQIGIPATVPQDIAPRALIAPPSTTFANLSQATDVYNDLCALG